MRTRAAVQVDLIALPVSDPACRGGGALVVQRTLARLDGVIEVSVSPVTETRCVAYVECDARRVSPDDLLAALEQVGFRSG